MENQFQDIMSIEELSIDIEIYFIYIVLLLFIGILIYLYTKFLFKSKEKKLNLYEQKVRKLKELNLDTMDTKQMLYEFTILAKDTAKQKESLDFILEKIEPLKYKKGEVKLEEKTKELLRGYIDDI